MAEQRISEQFIGIVEETGSDKLKIRFEDEDMPSKTWYPYTRAVQISIGDRVKLVKMDGSYLVEYPISTSGKGESSR